MPLSIEFLSGGRGLELVGSGVLTAQEILEAKGALLRSPERLRELHHALIDITDVTELRVTHDDVLEFVTADMQIALIVPRPMAVAVVAPGDLAFGVARMWEGFAEVTRWNRHVFRSRPEAELWLRPWVEGRLPAGPHP
ncbi:MAG TPA: hypothetical protein VMT97_18040 [Terriglobales bacterium]|nr:hypothetical protein [Terriglobales bacterium]